MPEFKIEILLSAITKNDGVSHGLRRSEPIVVCVFTQLRYIVRGLMCVIIIAVIIFALNIIINSFAKK